MLGPVTFLELDPIGLGNMKKGWEHYRGKKKKVVKARDLSVSKKKIKNNLKWGLI